MPGGKHALTVISMVKLFGTQGYVKAANLGLQIPGDYGYIMKFDLQRHFREARVTIVTA